ncbi:hypothetical protein C2S53_015801 [Perilla frutescens var. hirtella]|uniref:Uncharacterized protein n=1 Tax=Perilla frutescens var. hirtella TaxID=608512 RepID=A0AAD4IRU4_PERFH|nr:hypothetical protein C2S53_015801 [Perilla frutescens var. hirtella]
MDENEGERRSSIIPLIYTFFCLCVSVGGMLLVFYVCIPALSRPWQPLAALALIGSTWLFWLMAYIYACVKHCLRPVDVAHRQPTRNTSISASAAGSPSTV